MTLQKCRRLRRAHVQCSEYDVVQSIRTTMRHHHEFVHTKASNEWESNKANIYVTKSSYVPLHSLPCDARQLSLSVTQASTDVHKLYADVRAKASNLLKVWFIKVLNVSWLYINLLDGARRPAAEGSDRKTWLKLVPLHKELYTRCYSQCRYLRECLN